MAKFISVTKYDRGFHDCPFAVVINVDHIVSVWESTTNTGNGFVPVVHVQTTASTVIVAGTLKEFMDKVCQPFWQMPYAGTSGPACWSIPGVGQGVGQLVEKESEANG